MVNLGIPQLTIIGGIIVLAVIAYEEYKRYRHRRPQLYEAPSRSFESRAPPQPPNHCTICHDMISAPLEILPCGHIFHRKCIGEWFKFRWTCAICRLNIPDNLRDEYSRRLRI